MENTTLYKALLMIRKLKKLLQEKNNTYMEPIAIVGLSCRFPGAHNKNEFWNILANGKNSISKIPDERWQLLNETSEPLLRQSSYPYYGGYLQNIAEFDAYHFGISPREARRMDPQHRILLEVAHEAIVDAGLSKEMLAGSQTGVFASLYASQFGFLQTLQEESDALYIPTGNATSIAANRLSYFYDLRGPSIVLDTACSSSLVAVHLACLHLQNKLCDIALVGGVNINLLPSMSFILAKAKMLSPDGQCKTFDAGANGYVQGEGAGVIVLKPLSAALQNKDCIYAIISGSAVNQDGKTNGLTAPNGLLQEHVLKAAYSKAAINPAEISYIECHGTGTYLGDPIEVQALGEVISQHRLKTNPCWIGSVKTNIGHLEPAAGMASIIKVALALKYLKIPPHLNYVKPNPHINFDKYFFKIPTQLMDWPKYGMSRMAGISGFGFGGTNAHLLLRELSDAEMAASPRVERALPSWKHEYYWPALRNKTNFFIYNKNPLQSKKITSPLPVLLFEFTFDFKNIPELEDTFDIAHAGYFLEMLAFAANEILQKSIFIIEKLNFLATLMIPKNITVTVQLVLNKITDKHYYFNVYSHSQNDELWIENARGELLLNGLIKPEIMTIDTIEDIKQRCLTNETADNLYARVLSMGMPAGDSIRWTEQYWLGKDEILCEFKEPKICQEKEKFNLALHPGIIDGCIQPIFRLLPITCIKPYMAVSIDKITYFGANEGPFYLYSQLKTNDADYTKIKCHCYLIDKENKLIAAFETITLQQLNKNIHIENTMQTSHVNFDFTSHSFTESKAYVLDILLEQSSLIFSMPKNDININLSLSHMGFDSLMAIALAK